MSHGPAYSNGAFQVTCPGCRQTNAVQLQKIDKGPVCGSCQAPLPVPDAPVELTDDSFQDFVSRSPLPVLVDFWAPWCGPCRMMGPVLESFARKRSGRAIVAKLDTQTNQRTAGAFGIKAIPTLVVFRLGQEVARKVGAVPESALEALVPVD